MTSQNLDFYLELLQYQPIEILSEGEIMDKVKKIFSHVKNRMSLAVTTFKKYGINLLELGKKGAKKFEKKLWQLFQKGVSVTRAARKLRNELILFVAPFLKKMVKRLEKLNVVSKVMLRLLAVASIICIVFVLNASGVALLQNVGFSPLDATVIALVAVSPVLEEAMKTFFIKLKMPWTGTTLFAGFELGLYGMIMIKSAKDIPKFLIKKAARVLITYLGTYAQKKTKEELEKKGGVSETKKYFKMWMTGVIVHILFKTTSLLMNWKKYGSLFDGKDMNWWANIAMSQTSDLED